MLDLILRSVIKKENSFRLISCHSFLIKIQNHFNGNMELLQNSNSNAKEVPLRETTQTRQRCASFLNLSHWLKDEGCQISQIETENIQQCIERGDFSPLSEFVDIHVDLRQVNGDFDITDSKSRTYDVLKATRFQLAIISQREDLVKNVFEGLKQSSKSLEADTRWLLSVKTRLDLRVETSLYHEQDKSLDALNALHVAVKFHSQSLRLIRSFVQANDIAYQDLIEVKDASLGLTPLMMACQSPQLASDLIEMGCKIQQVDFKGNTALHHAVKKDADATCSILLANGADPNVKNESSGSTTLHLARSVSTAEILLKHGASPSATNNNGLTAIDVLCKYQPSVVKTIFDSAITTNGKALDSNELEIYFDYGILFGQAEEDSKTSITIQASSHEDMDEMKTFKAIIGARNSKLLKHPLLDTFLHFKWMYIRKIFLINFICHLLFVLSLTANVIFAARLGRCNMTVSHSQELDLACVFNQYNESSLPRLITLHFEKENYLKPVGFILSLGPSLIGFTFVFIKELIQAITSPKKYSQSTINYVDIGLIMACLVTFVSMPFDRDTSYHAGAWAVFIGWWRLSLLLGQFPSIGVYIFLATSVMKTLVMFSLMYMPILMSFAFLFHILLPNKTAFLDIHSSILMVANMMIGELEFTGFFLKPNIDVGQDISAQIAFVLFILVGNIVIANLLIALTVSRTENLLSTARIMRLKKIVKHICHLEDIIKKVPWLSKWMFSSTSVFAHFENFKMIGVKPNAIEQMKRKWFYQFMLSHFLYADPQLANFNKDYVMHFYDRETRTLERNVRQKIPRTPAWIINKVLKRKAKLYQRKQQSDNIASVEKFQSDSVEMLATIQNELRHLQQLLVKKKLKVPQRKKKTVLGNKTMKLLKRSKQ